MQAILYTNNSDDRALDKSLSTVATINVALKDDTEVITPVMILSPSVTQSFNYVYLADTGRYYYVTGRTYSQQRYIVNLSVDVRMTYANDIKALTVIANRSSSRFNLYQTDGEISFLNKNDIITTPFPNGFGGYSMILAVNGGGHSQQSNT